MLQIVLHAAAILVCVKRHNKPGWRTCLGGGDGGAEGKVEVVGGGWGGGLKVSRCFEQRNGDVIFFIVFFFYFRPCEDLLRCDSSKLKRVLT